MNMKKHIGITKLFLAASVLLAACSEPGIKEISFIETTDIHGFILPYDYIEKKDAGSSLASIYAYVRQEREAKKSVVLLDNGDNLQGQPEVYYYNFVDTLLPHLLPEAMNFMKYDAVSVGNHDVETGHAVYDRIRKNYNFPMLAANAVDVKSGNPYFKPYHIIKRNDLKIAVLGLVTTVINNTLPEELYTGIEFVNLYDAAQKWMPVIQAENPDLIVGLFHTGWNGLASEAGNNTAHEEGAEAIAYSIPGFDLIFTGHDHKVANEKIVNIAGDTTLILNAGSHAMNIAQADIKLQWDKKLRKYTKHLEGRILKTAGYAPDTGFVNKFRSSHEQTAAYVDEVIGSSSQTITSRDSYFGSSAFVDMIHRLQLEITEADISFAAPLSFDVEIPEGAITVSDMFKLYKYENMLYTMVLSGEEIKKILEYSYAGWFNTIKTADDHALRFRTDKNGKIELQNGKAWLQTPAYNFESAAGIDYTVDITKPEGSRVAITGMTGGAPFETRKHYRVAINSYRGNGGGGHLTRGAGIHKEDLMKRVVTSTDRDLRYYMIEYIKAQKEITPEALNNWKLVPEKLVAGARKRDYVLLFGNTSR
ncbi:MAG: bifunctional metallophosphatase/5'-nucleotidase [Bacteroidales bacterium]|nr:bifunctional metallophosphatase/5'-nucleotidase [Bacteroidales bacterium]